MMRGISEVVAKIRSRLESNWASAVIAELGRADGFDDSNAPHNPVTEDKPPWPHRVPLGKIASAELQRDFASYVRQLHEWRDWATQHHVELVYGTRMVSGTRQDVITHVHVPDINTAAHLAGDPWPVQLELARARAGELRRRFPGQPNPVGALRTAVRLSELDFDILCRVCDWFLRRLGTADTSAGASRRATSSGNLALMPMTPRQVPIEGVHAKWLDTHQGLVRLVTGIDHLGLLPPHPARFHFTYLDPDHLGLRDHAALGAASQITAPHTASSRPGRGRQYDSYSVGDAVALPYQPAVVLISENKDTAIGFPTVPGGIAIEGEGRGAGTIAAAPWVRAAPLVVYWGDIDLDGLEILNEFRATGLTVESILMDTTTYERYQRYGTNHDRRGSALTARPPRDVPHLREGELALYALLTSGTAPVLRIEQERIPIEVARRHLDAILTRTAATAVPG
jgi:hypothetical protein